MNDLGNSTGALPISNLDLRVMVTGYVDINTAVPGALTLRTVPGSVKICNM